MVVGEIIEGGSDSVSVRQKQGETIEIGELLVVECDQEKYVLQCYDLEYGSQIGQMSRELVAGMELEGFENMEILDSNISNYIIANMKIIAKISDNGAVIPKTIPKMFGHVRRIRYEDVKNLLKSGEIFLGKLRSGSKELNIDVRIKLGAIPHHILISATTGRGKSMLAKVLCYSLLENESCALLIFDPHDEYYGRAGKGLKDFSENIVYYSSKPPAGGRTLVFNLKNLRPWHFIGVTQLSEAQIEAMYTFYNKYKEKWIYKIIEGEQVEGVKDETLSVLKRKFSLLGIDAGVFSTTSGERVMNDILEELENGKTVIIDTSSVPGEIEVVIASMVSSELFSRYKNYKIRGVLLEKPVVGILIEEAPRVLGKDVVQSGGNIFTTIAREGRKFKIGLIAITQLPSLIPKEILANMNTKIILGTELPGERSALIESAAQDLTKDERNIASLGIGEAIVTSNFVPFAIPIKVPNFELFKPKNKIYKPGFMGVGIG